MRPSPLASRMAPFTPVTASAGPPGVAAGAAVNGAGVVAVVTEVVGVVVVASTAVPHRG